MPTRPTGLTLKKDKGAMDSIAVGAEIQGPNFVRLHKFWVPSWTEAGEANPDSIPPVYKARSPFWYLRSIPCDLGDKRDEAHDEVRLIRKMESVDCTNPVVAKGLLKGLGGRVTIIVKFLVYTNEQARKAGSSFPAGGRYSSPTCRSVEWISLLSRLLQLGPCLL